MRNLNGWHFGWILILVAGVLFLSITLAIAFYHSENSTFANVASIWGLLISLPGFIVTIYTLFETQRVTREAQHKIEVVAEQAQAAVKSAQEQTRQVLERVRHSIRDADFSTLYMWIRELRTAASLSDWDRALVLSAECSAVAERLRNAEGLEDVERQGLREGADNLRLVHTHIRDYRKGKQITGLAANHARTVDALATLLERLGDRLRHEPTRDAPQ
jgi:hypothetical protein